MRLTSSESWRRRAALGSDAGDRVDQRRRSSHNGRNAADCGFGLDPIEQAIERRPAILIHLNPDGTRGGLDRDTVGGLVDGDGREPEPGGLDGGGGIVQRPAGRRGDQHRRRAGIVDGMGGLGIAAHVHNPPLS